MSVVSCLLIVDVVMALIMRNFILETPVKYAVHFMGQARKSTNYGAINISFEYEHNLAQSLAGPYKIAK